MQARRGHTSKWHPSLMFSFLHTTTDGVYDLSGGLLNSSQIETPSFVIEILKDSRLPAWLLFVEEG